MGTERATRPILRHRWMSLVVRSVCAGLPAFEAHAEQSGDSGGRAEESSLAAHAAPGGPAERRRSTPALQ